MSMVTPEAVQASSSEAGGKKNIWATLMAKKQGLAEKYPTVFKIVTRKNLIIFCSALLIGGAIWLNWELFKDDLTGGSDYYDYPNGDDANAGAEQPGAAGEQGADQVGADKSDSYFASMVISRQRARDESIQVLLQVVESEEALKELKEEATESMNRIAGQIEQEANIESLVTAKGFSDCVAVVSDKTVTIVVASDGLLPNETIQIKEIAVEQTGIQADSVKIIEHSTKS